MFPNLNINSLSNWQLFKPSFDFQQRIPISSQKDQSCAKTPVGSGGIFTPESPQLGPSGSDSLEEVSSTLRANLDRLLELSSMRQKEALQLRSQLRELNIRREAEAKEVEEIALKFKVLSAKRETEAKEAQEVTLKLKELSKDHKNLTDQANFVQIENDKLARVLSHSTFDF